MATAKILLGVFGGLGLFIYGMSLMSKGLQRAAGDKLRRMLELLTFNRYIAVFTGVIVTILVQSSSTTTVMVVGFVNAGLMALNQAVGIILGARIGTTITAQIIAFKITDAALPIIGIGVIMAVFMKKRSYRSMGQAFLGFGLLFLGLNIMGGNLGQLKDSPAFISLLTTFGERRVLGMLAGAFFTAVIQSSSAAVGVIIALASQGILNLDAALALTLGSCAGTSITAVLASIGANLAARRAALAHVIFSTLGALMFIGFLDPITNLISLTSTDIARQIAWGHTSFAVVSSLVYLPFIPLFTRVVNWLLPGEERIDKAGQQFLDRRLLLNPPMALAAAKKEIERMAALATEMLDNSIAMLFKNNLSLIQVVQAKEEIVDQLESDISVYLAELSQRSITPAQGRELANYFHAINDIERIGDHALNIAQLCEERVERSLAFSSEAMEEIKNMYSMVIDTVTKVFTALETLDSVLARAAIISEQDIDRMERRLRDSHLSRIHEGLCFPPSGVIFLDIVANLERIGDHATNVAQAVLGEL